MDIFVSVFLFKFSSVIKWTEKYQNLVIHVRGSDCWNINGSFFLKTDEMHFRFLGLSEVFDLEMDDSY